MLIKNHRLRPTSSAVATTLLHPEKVTRTGGIIAMRLYRLLIKVRESTKLVIASRVSKLKNSKHRRDIANLGFPARSIKLSGLNAICLEGSYIEKAIKMFPNPHRNLTLDEEVVLDQNISNQSKECSIDGTGDRAFSEEIRDKPFLAVESSQEEQVLPDEVATPPALVSNRVQIEENRLDRTSLRQELFALHKRAPGRNTGRLRLY
ncbi:hypothetical protein H5410_061679 [Solanum commersonii]|uniref:Uncharacterized protein n=1 Tax=Solanum commersonii TaxID=4109 RepID=A0A9J5W8N8_SOLCO|nr:hypothetical protein H5410_061679 [Solanum commersonii]